MSDALPDASPSASAVDSEDFAPVVRGRGRPTVESRLGVPTSSLNYKVKTLSMIIDRMNKVKIGVNREGDLLVSVLEAMISEAESEMNDPAVRQKYHQNILDAVLRVHELHTKASAECFDLETKRSDIRMKRQIWKDKNGIGKLVNAKSEGDSMAEVAALMRGK